MKTGKKIAVGLAAALAIAMIAAGAVSMVGAIEEVIEVPAPFVVEVKGTPDVSVGIGDGGVNFAALQKGECKTLLSSLVLANNGDATARVEVRLIPFVGEVYGLVNEDSSAVLAASNLELGTTDNEVALDDTGADVDLGEDNYVPAQKGTIIYNAKLTIPAGQIAGTFRGVAEITISNAEE